MPGTPRARDNQLKCQWGKLADQKADLVFCRGEGVPKADAHLLHNALTSVQWKGPMHDKWDSDPSLLEELDRRGYDISTLKISIEKKKSF